MPVLAENRILRLAVLCALYLCQGLPFGFISVTLAAYLAEAGADTTELGGVLAFALLPWSFKWVWAPVVDRFARSRMGRRRPWIAAAQAMMIATAAGLLLVPEPAADLQLLGWLVFAHGAFAALQDVSVDALAVDLLPENERGFANGLMYGGSYLGIMIGGAGLSTVVGRHGLEAAVLVQLGVLTAVALLPPLLRERREDRWLSFGSRPAHEAHAAASIREVVVNLGRAFARRSPLLGLGLALTMQLGASVLTAIGTVLLMQRLGWTQEEYGQVLGGAPVLFGLAGSVAGGFIADRLGHRRTIAVASVLVGVSWLIFAAGEPYWTDRRFIVAMSCAENLLIGVLSAASFALFMDLSWKRVAATQFTAYMALMNLSRTIGAKLAGPVEDTFGTAGSYAAMGVVQILVIAWLLPMRPHPRPDPAE